MSLLFSAFSENPRKKKKEEMSKGRNEPHKRISLILNETIFPGYI